MLTRNNFDSDEEYFFYHWLKEAEQNDLVSNIKYQPAKYPLCDRASIPVEKKLKTKTKIVDKFLFHPHVYTPDFSFCPAEAIRQLFIATAFIGSKEVVVDIKGGFNAHGDPKQFSINQKWVWVKYGTYVEKIVPEKFFKKSWVPEICRFTPKKRQPVKKYIGVSTISEFIESRVERVA